MLSSENFPASLLKRVAIKNENITSFGGICKIMEAFQRTDHTPG